MASNLPGTDQLFGATVVDNDGSKIGKVEEVYLDNASGQPEWVSVKTGLFGSNVSLIPLAQASFSGDTMTVPFDKAKVKDAPHHDPAAELSESDEDDLYRYYGVGTGTSSTTNTTTTSGTTGGMTTGDRTGGDLTTSGTTTGQHTATGDRTTADLDDRATSGRGHDTSGPNTDDAMTRSKEELRVGTERREAGRARLRKYITSETVERQVPVSHEEVVVRREPITDANRGDALSGGDLTEEEHEVVLTEERAVAAKETVPVERVQLDTERVQGTETVSAEVREEHIDLDADETVKNSSRNRD
ncbi:DUF2382 domain-containing protein [Kineococcus rubinsiae]|uniref:DUF2382 domain-containing protein n=1 Tax=Kineococcus rubinsiae TaxID=2609562 RepID=UPI0014308495|nr:PRC and DUF2382 domain-containing protein [Kineococcus rubinsiae]NIZ89537.1 DUF2382 domain-containing protein [Kineococcus rubinsiae]